MSSARLAELKAKAERVLGHEARLVSLSKFGYRERRPTNLAVFNSRVVSRVGATWQPIWFGDLDLTLWEQRLAVLARVLDQDVFLLYESQARAWFDHPPRVEAIAVFSRGGEVEIPNESRYIVRADDGTLRFELPPETRRRWTWSVLAHRPRLWRLWVLERHRSRPRDSARATLVYLGARDAGETPLLVLAYVRESGAERYSHLEWTWYPAHERRRYAPDALLRLTPSLRIGRLRCWLRILIWPAFVYELSLGYRIKPSWW